MVNNGLIQSYKLRSSLLPRAEPNNRDLLNFDKELVLVNL
jgi:hypothetical protein